MPAPRFKRAASLFATALLFAFQPAVAKDQSQAASDETADPAVGEYVFSQMELIAGLRLHADGTFEYGLTVGSLDERAQGRWKRAGDRIELVSDPRPLAPTVTPDTIEATPGKPFAIRVRAPNGRDVPGIDLRIDFETGAPLESYLDGGPWTFPADEHRHPRFVTFTLKGYRIDSGPLPLHAEDGTTANYLLTPNDFGVVDLTGTYLERQADGLLLSRPEGTILFKRRSN
ncbi:hypothetical protein IDJ81_00470 [Tsuneonella flava]|uniref:Uncharacterized protein n=1 Tax=Tsuneonella flava TaxID=2055955 RepID=A0ABX7K8X2_9SPHN|nr:hypothetical protein [Tsuneonella flava]QSB44709.1 hypothetical protein IDJ81_00470 [Tsuneonella flava]